MLKIKEVIREKGLTQAEMAEKMGISRSAIVKILSGNPTIGMIQKIADTLGVHILDLFDDDRQMEKPPFECPHCHKPIIVKIE